jgi:hypothetical protein
MGDLHISPPIKTKDNSMPSHKSLAHPIWTRWLPSALLLVAATQAHAVPSFARQTGQDCAACHVGAFGPQLTPYGVKFKLGGYVDGNGKANVPLSGMVVVDASKYKEFNEDGSVSSKTKSGLSEASLFVAGKLMDHVGSFLQITNNGVEHRTGIDQAEVRVTGTTTMGEHEVLMGVSFNNNPTVQDPFNTLSVWGYPYTGTDRVAYPGGDQVSASVEQRVLGINAYALINDNIYAELGTYNSLSPAVQSRLGAGRYPEEPGVAAPSLSNAPYWRLAYMQDLRTRAWNVGLLGFSGTLKDRLDSSATTKFNDLGIDGSYQFLGNREHVVTVNGSWLREKVDESASNTSFTTRTIKLAASYNYLNTYGASVGYFTSHSSDTDAASSNSGLVYQADWTPWGKESSWNAPWANLRLGAQYVKMNAATGVEKTSDLNSLRLFAWTSF